MQKITPCLWFDDNAEEAVDFYMSVFEDSKILRVAYYSDAGPGPKGTVMTIVFELQAQEFMALNGGPYFKFTEAVSLIVHCKTQDEIDWIWDKMTTGGGKEVQCGWLKDKFGLSWQIMPEVLPQLVTDKDPKKVSRVMHAIRGMKKLDIKALQKAYDGK